MILYSTASSQNLHKEDPLLARWKVAMLIVLSLVTILSSLKTNYDEGAAMDVTKKWME